MTSLLTSAPTLLSHRHYSAGGSHACWIRLGGVEEEGGRTYRGFRLDSFGEWLILVICSCSSALSDTRQKEEGRGGKENAFNFTRDT